MQSLVEISSEMWICISSIQTNIHSSLYIRLLLEPPARIVVNHELERMWKEEVKGKVHRITWHEGTKVEKYSSTLPLTSAPNCVSG